MKILVSTARARILRTNFLPVDPLLVEAPVPRSLYQAQSSLCANNSIDECKHSERELYQHLVYGALRRVAYEVCTHLPVIQVVTHTKLVERLNSAAE